MPLPKSILCSACNKTYPEGWRRCPYCGHDAIGLKQQAIAQKYMQRKVQDFEQKFGRERKPPRPETRGQERRQGQQRPQQEDRPGRGRRRRRRGARPRAQSGSAPPPPPDDDGAEVGAVRVVGVARRRRSVATLLAPARCAAPRVWGDSAADVAPCIRRILRNECSSDRSARACNRRADRCSRPARSRALQYR